MEIRSTLNTELLEALKAIANDNWPDADMTAEEYAQSVVNRAESAVSEPVKPVAYFQLVPFGKSMIYEQVVIHSKEDEGVFPLYAAPPASVPLTPLIDELLQHCTPYSGHLEQFHKAVTKLRAAAIGEKQ